MVSYDVGGGLGTNLSPFIGLDRMSLVVWDIGMLERLPILSLACFSRIVVNILVLFLYLLLLWFRFVPRCSSSCGFRIVVIFVCCVVVGVGVGISSVFALVSENPVFVVVCGL